MNKTMEREKIKEGMTIKKEKDFSEWYQQLILKADLADYTKVSGSIVFKPTSYLIWEKIQQEIDERFKKLGIQDAYFPLFIPESLLKKEKEHIAGFSPEVAWVTQAGNTKLKERLAVRPTSEAIMYDSFSKWIRSWRDLPLKINQWNNVVRWEFKHPVPFLRTREFLWNEGHTVYANEEEAAKEKDQILNIYNDILKELMALSGLIGKKTQKEKFAGARETYTIELYLPNGRAIQGPDFHDDGQNFAKAYNIKFLDKNKKERYVWQNTFAITTRMLGVMFAIHSDNKGLVLPPKIAPNKLVIVPIFTKKDKDKIIKQAKKLKTKLSKLNPILDDREDYSPGWKFNEWELKGIPLRVEIGPKDLKKKQAVVVKRTDGKKKAVKITALKRQIEKLLDEMQNQLYKKADKMLKSNITRANSLEELKKQIKNKKIVLAPLCSSRKCEDMIKYRTGGAKTLNIPEKQPALKNKKCIYCSKPAQYFVYIGKSY